MKTLNLLTLAAALPLLASCSIIQGKMNTGKISGASAVQTTQAKQTAATTPTAPTEGVVDITEPAAPKETPAPAASPAAAPVAPAASVASTRDLSGEWLIVQVGSTIVDRDEDMPYIIFDAKAGRFYGNNGCNIVNGSYSLSADDVFSFSAVSTTMRYCPDVDIQHAINVALGDGSKLKARFSEIGSESYIDFLSDSGKELLKLRRANLDFLNGNWSVETINGATLDQPADVFFDIAERKIHGNTGCNYFNGEIYIDHRQPNAIDFSKMGLTRMACPYSAQETAMMVALEQTTTALSGGRDVAMLLDADGHEVITLRRLPLEEQ